MNVPVLTLRIRTRVTGEALQSNHFQWRMPQRQTAYCRVRRGIDTLLMDDNLSKQIIESARGSLERLIMATLLVSGLRRQYRQFPDRYRNP